MASLHFLFDKDAPEMALKSIFSKYDINGDENLDKNELSELLRKDFGLDPEQAELYAYILDEDGDNQVSYEEFKIWMKSNENLSNIKDQTRFCHLKHALQYFQKYDDDNNRSLDKSELRQLYLEFGGEESQLEQAMKEVDTDNNGRISFQEFLTWLKWGPVQDLFCKHIGTTN